MRSLRALDVKEERVLAGQLAGALYLLGAVTGSLLLVLPGVRVDAPGVVLVLAGLGALWGLCALLVVDWRQAPPVVSHLSTGLGLPITAAVMADTGGSRSPALFFVFFVVVYCSSFYPPREAVPHLIGVCVVVLLPLLYERDAIEHGALAQAAVVIPTVLVLARLIMGGKRVLLDLRREAERLSRTDPLTGLANRRAFTDELEAQLQTRRGGDHRVGLLMLDLDGFKAANSLHGHPAGDRVLCEVATVLGRVTRREDMTARLGGDEFAVLAKNTDEDEMAALSDRMLAEFRTTDLSDELPGFELRASAGWAIARPGEQTATALVGLADASLRWAKVHGKDRWAVLPG
jgi:diguanylate cyclase (GGDEF)-like protein